MAVPGPPPILLLPLVLLLLLRWAAVPVASYALSPGRTPQHKILHLGESGGAGQGGRGRLVGARRSATARHVTHPDATVNLEAVVDMLDYLVWVLRGNVCVCVCMCPLCS